MSRAVFDTNVVVAGFLSPTGPPGRLVEWLRGGRVQAVMDDRIAAEYVEIVFRPKFGLPRIEVELVLGAIEAGACWIESGIEHWASDLPDPDDAPFIECARAAGVPLVTGDARHFPKSLVRGVSVLTPLRFLQALRDGTL